MHENHTPIIMFYKKYTSKMMRETLRGNANVCKWANLWLFYIALRVNGTMR